MRVLFMGSPAFALPTLRVLAADLDVCGVVTAPDRPAGRGRALSAPPVKDLALQLGLTVLQPVRLRGEEVLPQLAALAPDLVVVAAYGQILPPEVLDLPRHGSLNLHASLLPRHRGASPIPAAILAGDEVTGVTLMKMDAGLDTGPLLAQETMEILPHEDTGALSSRLAELAALMTHRDLPRFLRGELTPTEQDASQATYAPALRGEDGKLDFRDSASALERRIRAVTPWPGAHCLWKEQRLRIIKAEPVAAQVDSPPAEPGRVLQTPAGPAVRTGEGDLLLLEVQLPGRRPLPAREFLRGARGFLGSKLQ